MGFGLRRLGRRSGSSLHYSNTPSLQSSSYRACLAILTIHASENVADFPNTRFCAHSVERRRHHVCALGSVAPQAREAFAQALRIACFFARADSLNLCALDFLADA